MLESIESAAAVAGLTLKGLLAGAIGSFISLRFFDGLSTWERWTTFMGGWAVASYGGPAVTALLSLSPRSDLFMTLLLGMFGMSIAAAVIKVIRDTDWKAIVRGKFGGQP